MTDWRVTGRTSVATIAALGLVAVLMGTLATSALALTRVSVRPGTGGPKTHFVIRFRAPERTGRIGAIRRTDRLYATGPKASGCISTVRLTLPPVRRGDTVRVVLRPRTTAKWCAGRFRARIVRTESLICSGTCAGPRLPVARTIARFSFRVRGPATSPSPAPSPGGGPTFAGIKSATLCEAGAPKVAPPTRSYTVSWDAATDPSTPSNKIVYDIYYSSTSGGENFSSPLATTGPGDTAYSGSLPGSGSAYFVVRARDAAGREDSNRVEKMAVNTC
ncbi:MAG TPA: hypothetical protein VGG87_09850 [Solirubrobacteraceae bacterium]